MVASYFFQFVSLLIGVLMVPMLLRYLDHGQFLLWAIFTTLGGLTLQIESSIQIVSVRRIARDVYSGRGLASTLKKVRQAYIRLATLTVGPLALVGFLYLSFFAAPRLSASFSIEWIIFVTAYGINYWFGTNNAVLLATAHVNTYSYIASCTRLLYFVGTLWSLYSGFGILGICICFASSVVINCMLMRFAAHRALVTSSPTQSSNPAETAGVDSTSDIVPFTLYTIAAFVVYKFGVLTATSFFDKEAVSSFSLTLQAYALLSSFALVPLQARLSRFVKALMGNRQKAVIHELTFTLVTANVLYVVGIATLALAGDAIFDLIGAQIGLPSWIDLITIGLAFAIELNIFVFINLLVTKKQFHFVRVYVTCVLGALLVASMAILMGQSLIFSLVILPAIVQGFICLPAVVRLVCKELGMTPSSFFKATINNLWPSSK